MISSQSPDPEADRGRPAALATRGVFGGILMGLANLVPGISGGTMLLAAGIYPQFIDGVAEITTLRFRPRTIVLLGSVIAAALVAFVGLAGPVKDLVVHHRWIMYSLFIGLTLGGVPLLWRMIGRHSAAMWVSALIGFLGMTGIALIPMLGSTAPDRSDVLFMFIAGIVGASAMILPGVSGGYLLLVLGVYVPLLGAVAEFKDALPVVGESDGETLIRVGLSVIGPAGLGVIVGIALVSNLLKWCLHRFERPTLGVLLGLLIGAVIGIWPFQAGLEPAAGDTLKNQPIVLNADGELTFETSGRLVEPDDWPTQYFAPSAGQIAAAFGLIVVGFTVSAGIARIGGNSDRE